jgi:hypothetical protein
MAPEVPVPETLAAPHRFVAAIIEEDREHAERARLNRWPRQSWYQSEPGIRELRILSALYDALEKRGHRLEHPKGSVQPVWCVIGGERIEFYIIEYVRPTKVALSRAELKEPLNIADGRTTKTVQKATGQLVLLASRKFQYQKRRWSDSDGPLEKQLGTIILKFEQMAEQAAADRIEWKERNRQIEEKIACENEERARRQKEEEDWERLREMARDWAEAERLRRFLDVVGTRLQPLSDEQGHGRTWLNWARARVAELDPMGTDAETTFSQLLEGHGMYRWEEEEEEGDEW